MLALEMVAPNTGKFWSTRCQGMKIYTEQELTSFLEKGGFENIRSHRTHRSWCAMEGIKRAWFCGCDKRVFCKLHFRQQRK